MRPRHETNGYMTFDLTACVLHFVDDRLIAFRPKKWKEMPAQNMMSVNGKEESVIPYLITEWEEMELDVKVRPK